MAAWIYERFLRETGGKATQRLRSGATVSLDLSDWPQAQAFMLRVYERHLVEFAVSRLPSCGVFIDGGAHVGLVSLQIAQRRPDVWIHAFEPHPRSASSFMRNKRLNPSRRVLLNQLGLSERPGLLQLDLGTHAIRESGHWIGVIPLDDYLDENRIESVDLLKLDLEGHELPALRGADRALSERRIETVVIEAMAEHASRTGANPLAAQSFLQNRGYVPTPLPRSPLDRWRALMKMPVREANLAFALPPLVTGAGSTTRS